MQKLSCIDLSSNDWDISSNDWDISDKSGYPIICFVCDPMCQIKKKPPLFGTLGPQTQFMKVWFEKKCDMIKQNESEVANAVFKI